MCAAIVFTCVPDESGLVEASKEEFLAWQGSNPEKEMLFDTAGNLDNLDERINITKYCFMLACLTNIRRHAGATRASTRLSGNTDSLVLSVSDNGQV